MPKKLKAHPNERIDLNDFVRAANEYTEESIAFNVERSVLDRRSRILGGFRVEVAEQTSNPGQITVYNGNAFDRDGTHLTNEDQANIAKTITLSGASQTFYVEIEFTETETDTDSRGFWDPTFDQTAPTPDGQEFSINATTRISPDWQIVTPVSTAGFDAVTNPDSTKIPLMVLVTDASNEIDTTAPGAGFTQVFASTVLEEDVASGIAEIRVVDALLFPDTGTITLDVGDASVEGPFTLTSVDRTNGVIQFAGGPTANSHNAGAIIRVASGVARFVPERVAGVESLTSPTQPDVAPRMYQGNEVRGSALSASKEVYGNRDDLQLRSLKDQVDFLSAQLRELKFGSMRPEIVSAAPPSFFGTTPRYFDFAGGVQGSRNQTITIGDGTASFGDFNGKTETPFLAAIAALPGSGGTIYIKQGSYAIGAKIVVNKPVRFIGEHQASVNLVIDAVADPLIEIDTGGTDVGFESLTLDQSAATTDNVISVINGGSVLEFDRTTLTGNIDISAGTGAVNIKARRLTVVGLNGSGGVAALNCVSTRDLSGHVEDSVIVASAGNDCIRGTLRDLYISNTQLIGAGSGESCIHIVGASDRLSLRSVYVSGSQVITYTGTVALRELNIEGCTVTSHTDTTGLLPLFEFYQLYNACISHVVADVLAFSVTSTVDPPEVFLIVNDGDHVVIENCQILAQIAQFTKAVGATMSGSLWVRDNTFTDMYMAIDLAGDLRAIIENNILEATDVRGQFGIRITSAASNQPLKIAGNTIITGTGVDSIGVRLDNASTTWNDVQIHNNTISGGDLSATTSEAKGIEITGTVGHIDISHNLIRNILAGGSAECYGISVVADALTSSILVISSNRLRTIGSNLSALQSSGIRVVSPGQIVNTQINDNVIVGVGTSSLSPVIALSYAVGDCSNIQICNNSIISSGGIAVSTDTRGVIELVGGGSGSDLDNLKISDNNIDTVGVGSIGGIRIACDPAALISRVIISDNNLRLANDAYRGIWITSSSSNTTTYTDMIVRGNIVAGIGATLAASTACISLVDASFVRVIVSNNVVSEDTFHASRHGIECASISNGLGITVAANEINGQVGNRGIAGIGIKVDNFEDVNIVGNNVRWIGTAGSGTGLGIEVESCERGVVSGNNVLPDSGAVQEILATTCTQMFLVGNSVGNTADNGTVSWSGTGMVLSTENNLTGV